MDIKRANGIE